MTPDTLRTEGVTSLRALHAPFLVTSAELVERVATSDLAGDLLARTVGVTAGATARGSSPPVRLPASAALRRLRGQDDSPPRSETTYAFFEALGAKPDDLNGDAFNPRVASRAVAAAVSSFRLASGLPSNAMATGNITFFPKVNSLGQHGGSGEAKAQQGRSTCPAERTLIGS